jgi:hypothetical protein
MNVGMLREVDNLHELAGCSFLSERMFLSSCS